LVDHAAKRDAIDITGMNDQTDQTAGELIHHYQLPIAFETNSRLTSEQFDTPKAILHMTKESGP
jgi:hypothetical protein